MTSTWGVLVALIAAQWLALWAQDWRHSRERRLHQEERDAWARERWELNTRIQAPEMVRAMPPPSPSPAHRAAEPVPVAGEPDEDPEYDLIGSVPSDG